MMVRVAARLVNPLDAECEAVREGNVTDLTIHLNMTIVIAGGFRLAS